MMMGGLLLTLAVVWADATPAPPPPPFPTPPPVMPAGVLAAARQALAHWSALHPPSAASCSWTDSTLMLGAVEYYKVSRGDAAALQGLTEWAHAHRFRVCGDGQSVAAGAAGAAAAPVTPQPPGGDDSCNVFVRGVAYTGATGGGGSVTATSASECCRRCRALGWRRCSYFTFSSGRCSLQGTTTTVHAAAGALSGWPSGGPCPPQCRHVAGGVRGPHGANSQLCAATYAELSQLHRRPHGTTNLSMVAGAERVLAEEMGRPSVRY
jgi:hypothetical protein